MNQTPFEPDISPVDDQLRVYAPWERIFERFRTPFEEFVQNEQTGGLVLLASTMIALFIANSPLSDTYMHLIHAEVAVRAFDWELAMSLQHWINEGLMNLFFFLVGLEIKREFTVGVLTDVRRAVLPVLAAAGGMLVPALIYLSVASQGVETQGWGIPMATDIAFAVGALSLLGRRIPRGVFVFLVSLAIVDDIGAVIVIGVFYSGDISVPHLLASALFVGGLLVTNRLGVRSPVPYFLLGSGLWLVMLGSGFHATLAGVITAVMIPAQPRYDPLRFTTRLRHLTDLYEDSVTREPDLIHNQHLRAILQTLENGVLHVQSPLQRLEHALHLPVALIVLPVFALANAGIPLHTAALSEAGGSTVAVGVVLGLVLGKPIGIIAATWLGIRLGLGQLPAATQMRHIVGIGLLAGIGFTVALFIAELAFSGHPALVAMAKLGVLGGSVFAAGAGILWLRLTCVDAGPDAFPPLLRLGRNRSTGSAANAG